MQLAYLGFVDISWLRVERTLACCKSCNMEDMRKGNLPIWSLFQKKYFSPSQSESAKQYLRYIYFKSLPFWSQSSFSFTSSGKQRTPTSCVHLSEDALCLKLWASEGGVHFLAEEMSKNELCDQTCKLFYVWRTILANFNCEGLKSSLWKCEAPNWQISLW